MNEREKRTVSRMIAIYCRSKHGSKNTLCDECKSLESYAHRRLDKCVFGNEKPSCQHCPVHCYKKEKKEAVREVMRFAGPRMLLHHPKEALIHLYFNMIRRKRSH